MEHQLQKSLRRAGYIRASSLPMGTIISSNLLKHQASSTLLSNSNLSTQLHHTPLVTMVRISAVMVAVLAGVAYASPAERRQTSSAASSTSDVVCGGLLQPLAGFLDYQSGNVGGNVNNILAAAGQLLEKTQLPSEVEIIVTSVTGGIVASLTNGVTNILYGLSTAADNVDPECRQNAAYCVNELRAAQGACASGQTVQAQDACPQAKYTCSRNNILTPAQVDSMAPCCPQYDTSVQA
jgi:hypothetical protein